MCAAWSPPVHKIRSARFPRFATAHRPGPRAGATHPMMNAIGGTSIHYHAQSWRLKPWDFKTVQSKSIKRYGAELHSARLDARRLAHRLRRSGTVLRHRRARGRRIGQGRQHRRASSIRGQHLRRAAPARVSDAAAARPAITRSMMAKAARSLGWKPFHPPAAINSEPYNGPPGLRLSRLLRSRRLPYQRQELDRCHHHSGSAEDQEPDDLRPGAGHPHRSRTRTARSPASPTSRDGKEYFQPAKVVLVGSYTYENVAAAAALEIEGVSQRARATITGQVGKHYFGHWDAQAGAGVSALFPIRSQHLVRRDSAQGVVIDEWADDNFDHSGLGFIGGASMHGQHREASDRRGEWVTWGAGAANGARSGRSSIHENAGRWASAYIQTNSFPYENTYPRSGPGGERSAGRSGHAGSPRDPRRMSASAAMYAQDKMEEWFRAAGAIE